MQNVYKNIGCLRIISDEALANVKSLSNIGVICYRQHHREQLKQLHQTNVGTMLEIDDDAKLILLNSDQHINQNFLSQLYNPSLLMINGTTFFDKMENFNADAIYKGMINGDVIIQEKHHAKLISHFQVNGTVYTYRDHELPIVDDCVIDDLFLKSLPDNSSLLVGNIKAFNYDHQLFSKKIKSLRIQDRLVCSQAALEHLTSYTEQLYKVDKCVVPNSFKYYKSLEINDGTVKKLTDTNIYVDELTITGGTEELLDNISEIKCHKLTIDEDNFERLQHLITGDYQVQFKDCSNYGKLKFTKHTFDTLSRKHYYNYGKLIFDNDIDVELLKKHLHHIENHGKILCSADQYHYLSSICTNYGVIKHADSVDEPTTEQPTAKTDDYNVISNMGYLEI